MEDKGDCHDLLGVEFEQTDDHLLLHQKAYIEKLSADFFSRPRAYRPPRDATVQEIGTSVDVKLLKRYQSLFGDLLYCAGNTRPDVSYAVGTLQDYRLCNTRCYLSCVV